MPNQMTMPPQLFKTNSSDSLQFVQYVEQIVIGRLSGNPSRVVYVMKVDNWFDHKWLNFLGTVGNPFKIAVWTGKLRIPPFAPNRIMDTLQFNWCDKSERYVAAPTLAIHKTWGDPNELWDRQLAPLADESGIFVWMSGNTEANGRGALMVYDVVGDQQDSWYCGFSNSNDWKIDRYKGTSSRVIDFFRERGRSTDLDFGPPSWVVSRPRRFPPRREDLSWNALTSGFALNSSNGTPADAK